MISRTIVRPDGSKLLVYVDTNINSFVISEIGKPDGKVVLYSISSGVAMGCLLLTSPSDMKVGSDYFLYPKFIPVTSLTDDELKVRLSDLIELAVLLGESDDTLTSTTEVLLGILVKVLEILTDLSKARLVVKSCRSRIVYGLDVVYERKIGSVLYGRGFK